MDLVEVIDNLIRFKTVTGNNAEIDNCLTYIYQKAVSFGAKADICRFDDASPVIIAKNTDGFDFDVFGYRSYRCCSGR